MKIPKKFYSMSKAEQNLFAIREMQRCQEERDLWHRLSIQSKDKHIPDPNIERPDEQLLKDGL